MTMQGQEYAVFTEFSPDNKTMTPGFNTRVFTDVDSQRGNSIRCDFKTGAITLAPGSYHITGFSMSTYNSGGEPPEMTTVRSPAAAGYCRLRTYDPKATVDPSNMQSIPNEDPSVFCVGSPCTPNMTPSLFEAYYTTEKEVQIILEHQMGHAPDKIYLRVNIEKSKWHVFARSPSARAEVGNVPEFSFLKLLGRQRCIKRGGSAGDAEVNSYGRFGI